MKRDRISFEAIPDEKGGLRPVNSPTVRARLAKWQGDRVLVTVSRGTIPKSLPQLGYYYGTVVPAVSEYTGFTEEEAHDELKRAWFPKRLATSLFTGEVVPEVPSLADATKEEMSEFLDTILMEMAKLGYHVPGPNESVEAI